jgi:hypothetical protein
MGAENLGKMTGYIIIALAAILFAWKFLDKKKK